MEEIEMLVAVGEKACLRIKKDLQTIRNLVGLMNEELDDFAGTQDESTTAPGGGE